MKRGEGKAEEEFVSDNLLPALAEFMNSKAFQQALDDFHGKHVQQFLDLAESKQDEVEYSHEHKDIFDSYQCLLDELFERFAQNEDVSSSAVYQCCKDAGKAFIAVSLSYF